MEQYQKYHVVRASQCTLASQCTQYCSAKLRGLHTAALDCVCCVSLGTEHVVLMEIVNEARSYAASIYLCTSLGCGAWVVDRL